MGYNLILSIIYVVAQITPALNSDCSVDDELEEAKVGAERPVRKMMPPVKEESDDGGLNEGGGQEEAEEGEPESKPAEKSAQQL